MSPEFPEILYAGYRYDAETGLYDVRMRYYHPTLGRWVTRDSKYNDGLNLYVYVAGNPAGLLDPTGQMLTEFKNCSNKQKPVLEAVDRELDRWLKSAIAEFESWKLDKVLADYVVPGSKNKKPTDKMGEAQNHYGEYYLSMLVNWRQLQKDLISGIPAKCMCMTDPKDPTKTAKVNASTYFGFMVVERRIYFLDPFFAKKLLEQRTILLDEATHIALKAQNNSRSSTCRSGVDVGNLLKDTDHYMEFSRTSVRAALETDVWQPLFFPEK